MDTEIMVSIICNAYNHEKYIRDALESFVMQKTNFKFEVLVHDDASTDATADIIKEYEVKYPELIKPIYQTENQFSQGVHVSKKIQYPRVKGKYIALCEGDDYWIKPYKLQKQFDFMESHSECTLVCHNSKKINCETGETSIESPFEKQGVVSAEEIILGKKNSWVATASLFLRKELLCEKPDFHLLSPVGDYSTRLHCLAHGDIYYMDEVMSVYNFKIPGSWSSGAWRKHTKKRNVDAVEFLIKYNEYTEYRFDRFVKEAIKNRKFSDSLAAGNLKVAKSEEMKELFKTLSKKEKLRAYIM